MLKDIFNPVRVTASVAGKEFIFENGRIANQLLYLVPKKAQSSEQIAR